MPNAKSLENLRPSVKTKAEGKALAALGGGRPAFERQVKAWSGKVYADQLEALDRLGVNKSELVRQLLDEYLTSQPK